MRKRITRRIDEKKGYMRDPKLEISNASEQAPADQSKPLSYRFLYISSLPSPLPVCAREHTCAGMDTCVAGHPINRSLAHPPSSFHVWN